MTKTNNADNNFYLIFLFSVHLFILFNYVALPWILILNITKGSRSCGACPSGYSGDGVVCSYLGPCHMNNGGCHPMATCVAMSG